MAGFAGVDFIDLDSALNDEEMLVRQTARKFVDNEVLPIIEQHNREATFPMHLMPQLGELGFFGANLKGYGCAEMSNVEYGLVMQEMERPRDTHSRFIRRKKTIRRHAKRGS